MVNSSIFILSWKQNGCLDNTSRWPTIVCTRNGDNNIKCFGICRLTLLYVWHEGIASKRHYKCKLCYSWMFPCLKDHVNLLLNRALDGMLKTMTLNHRESKNMKQPWIIKAYILSTLIALESMLWNVKQKLHFLGAQSESLLLKISHLDWGWNIYKKEVEKWEEMKNISSYF